ncbi:MAG: ABC transporter ATP-binding protein [Acidimicrobiia bacterium]|nr:MAG: ABC transporter ATP-binding protein [Acidimicrobiia bacterium]
MIGAGVVDRVLHVENVKVRFGGVTAVNGVSFEVEEGARWAVIGPNGAGKTTLFRTICGEVYPTDGRVHLFGRDVTRKPAHSRAQMGLGRTFQVTNLFPNLTVEENLAIAAQARSKRRFVSWAPLRIRGELAERIESALSRVGLSERRLATVAELSHGEQRQMEIAMALANAPRVLLLDEPAAGLSAAERSVVRQLIEELPRDLSIVLIEHDMDIALELVDRVLVLDNGNPIAEGTPDEIRLDPKVQDVYLRDE